MCFLVLESCNFSHVGHVEAVHYSIIKFNKFQRILFLSQLFVAFAQDLKTLNARATACRIPFALWNKSLSPKPQLAGRCERCLSFPSEWSIQYKGSMPMIQPMTTPTTDPVVFTRLAETCSSCINDNPCGGKPAIYNDIQKHKKWRATRMSKQNREIVSHGRKSHLVSWQVFPLSHPLRPRLWLMQDCQKLRIPWCLVEKWHLEEFINQGISFGHGVCHQ